MSIKVSTFILANITDQYIFIFFVVTLLHLFFNWHFSDSINILKQNRTTDATKNAVLVLLTDPLWKKC